MGESGARPGVGLLPANPCRTGWFLDASSSQDDGRVTRGWNGRAVAERVESNCMAENLCWNSQQARLRFSFSILLHPAKISLASEVLTHLHSPPSKVSHPGGDVSDCLTGGDGLSDQKTCPRVSLFPIKGQHVACPPRYMPVHPG